jgi:predicted GNAT family N-acyltransferase
MHRCLGGSSISKPNFKAIEPFGPHHKKLRAAFACGSSELDKYLKERATQDIDRRAAAVYVLLADNRIAGYYTLSADNTDVRDLPERLVAQLNLPRYPYIGATLIGRLARDLVYKGQGVGELLLVDALKKSLSMSRDIASAAVVVDAKDETAHLFYVDFGFVPFPDSQKKRLFLPMATIEKTFAR